MFPDVHALWIPAIISFTLPVVLAISFFGAAVNAYYRDVSTARHVALSLAMFLSPVIY